MVFFLVLPLWALVMIGAAVLLAFRRSRWLAIFAMATSTCAVIASFGLSTLGLFIGGYIGNLVRPELSGLLAISGYATGLLGGGLLGAAGGVFIVWRLHRQRSRMAEPAANPRSGPG